MAKVDRTWELLQEMNRKLDLHGEALAGLRSDAKHAEADIEEAKAMAKSALGKVGKVNITIAKWGGAVAASLVGLELFMKALGH